MNKKNKKIIRQSRKKSNKHKREETRSKKGKEETEVEVQTRAREKARLERSQRKARENSPQRNKEEEDPRESICEVDGCYCTIAIRDICTLKGVEPFCGGGGWGRGGRAEEEGQGSY